ncbi:hypothetical protein AGLY_004183 [Aphis glycines]|uniref:FERM N-terminal domain-containing protein n=1 Tax=Aphis glycines TaxID=307491 RepID=A0A6G0TXR4_APHGL|nr:hypothetical protein AGLY_004183 [Aphis glycines]
MWCLVSQPNAVVIEVRLDHKAKGLECLEKLIHAVVTARSAVSKLCYLLSYFFSVQLTLRDIIWECNDGRVINITRVKLVCECLGINKECDYFGLQYKTVKGQDVWLNLRNLIEHQVAGVHPYRFALRVKFWVPPHLLLQESTRSYRECYRNAGTISHNFIIMLNNKNDIIRHYTGHATVSNFKGCMNGSLNS